MIRLHFVQNGEDVYVNLNDNATFESVMREVQILQSKGIKMVGLESSEVKLFFDDPKMGMKSINGRFKGTQRIV